MVGFVVSLVNFSKQASIHDENVSTRSIPTYGSDCLFVFVTIEMEKWLILAKSLFVVKPYIFKTIAGSYSSFLEDKIASAFGSNALMLSAALRYSRKPS